MPQSPLELPEIRMLIAEHLSRAALLACCRVSRDWHSSFLPCLWRSVVFKFTGPVFYNPDSNDPRIAHIRRLKILYSTFEGYMPTQGYHRLEELEIFRHTPYQEENLTQHGIRGGCAVDRWHLLIAMMQSLANGPLSSLKLFQSCATPKFWEAAAQCRRLKSLHMDHAYFPCDKKNGPPFWKFCRSVETLSVFDSKAESLIHTRMLRLKHLNMVRSTVRYRDGWESAKSWLCSPNLETLCYNLSRTSSSYDEFHEMVLDIKAATVAAATGKNHYALGHGAHADELEEDMERYRGLIPGKKLHSLETDINIRDEDLGFLVDNMDTLRKLCLPKLPLGTATIGALGRHHRTIVELDLQCGSTNGTRALVKTVMNLAQLEDLALDLVDVEAFVQSGPWACLGLKRLAIAFQTLAPSDVATKIASESSRAIWQRLSCLTKLDHLTTYKGYFWSDRFQPFFTLECGLGLLSALTELRRVEADLNVLASPEAEWMIRTWPKLNLIYCERGPRDCIVDPKVVQAFKDKDIDVDTKPYFSSRSHDCRPGQ